MPTAGPPRLWHHLHMRLRHCFRYRYSTVLLLLLWVSACGGPTVDPNAPQTAAERARREAPAEEAKAPKPPKGKKWNGWRYSGERNDCFFTTGRKCYKTEQAACDALRCDGSKTCVIEGAGPATVRCG